MYVTGYKQIRADNSSSNEKYGVIISSKFNFPINWNNDFKQCVAF